MCDLQFILIGNEVFVFLFLHSPTCPQREDTLMVMAAMDGQFFTPRCITVGMVGTRGRTASSCLYCLGMTCFLLCFLFVCFYFVVVVVVVVVAAAAGAGAVLSTTLRQA